MSGYLRSIVGLLVRPDRFVQSSEIGVLLVHNSWQVSFGRVEERDWVSWKQTIKITCSKVKVSARKVDGCDCQL